MPKQANHLLKQANHLRNRSFKQIICLSTSKILKKRKMKKTEFGSFEIPLQRYRLENKVFDHFWSCNFLPRILSARLQGISGSRSILAKTKDFEKKRNLLGVWVWIRFSRFDLAGLFIRVAWRVITDYELLSTTY